MGKGVESEVEEDADLAWSEVHGISDGDFIACEKVGESAVEGEYFKGTLGCDVQWCVIAVHKHNNLFVAETAFIGIYAVLRHEMFEGATGYNLVDLRCAPPTEQR